MAKNQNGFTVWDEEFEKQFYTEEEREENTLQARLIGELIAAREENGMKRQNTKK